MVRGGRWNGTVTIRDFQPVSSSQANDGPRVARVQGYLHYTTITTLSSAPRYSSLNHERESPLTFPKVVTVSNIIHSTQCTVRSEAISTVRTKKLEREQQFTECTVVM